MGVSVACVDRIVIIIVIYSYNNIDTSLLWFGDISGCCHGDRFQLTDWSLAWYDLIIVKLCIQTTPTLCTSHTHLLTYRHIVALDKMTESQLLLMPQ